MPVFMQKNAFTLPELMIVITIIAILSLMVTNFDFNRKTDTEKRDRFVTRLVSMTNTNKINMITGRGVLLGGNIVNPSHTEIVVSSGSIVTHYYSGQTIIGTGEVISSPFFGESGYKIDSIYGYSDKSLTSKIIFTAPLRITFTSAGDISYSGNNITNDVIIIGLRMGYHWMFETIEFDRRSGKIAKPVIAWTGTVSTPTLVPDICPLGDFSGDSYDGDCGISPPPPATCSDSIQNQGEIAIDCGGPNCSVCPPVPVNCVGSWGSCTATCTQTYTITTPASGAWVACSSTNGASQACTGGSCVVPPIQSNPTSLTLSHTANSKTFTFSWTAGVGNGGSCKLQYFKNGTTWTDISALTYNCDTTIWSQLVTLPADGWNTNWSSISVRVIRTSDSLAMGTFPQNLTCSAVGASASSTPNVDENCNGTWDDYSAGQAYVASVAEVPQHGLAEVMWSVGAIPSSFTVYYGRSIWYNDDSCYTLLRGQPNTVTINGETLLYGGITSCTAHWYPAYLRYWYILQFRYNNHARPGEYVWYNVSNITPDSYTAPIVGQPYIAPSWQ